MQCVDGDIPRFNVDDVQNAIKSLKMENHLVQMGYAVNIISMQIIDYLFYCVCYLIV